MEQLLIKWSWQEIFAVYKIYGDQLIEYKRIAETFDLELPVRIKPGELIGYSDEKVAFIDRWLGDVIKVNRYIDVLDQEIARRNKLIGVMG